MRKSVTAGAPLYLEIVSTAEGEPECLLQSSAFSVVVSGPRIQRAQAVRASGDALLFVVQLDEPGEYRIEAFLRLFNDPHFFCEASVVRPAGARYVDRVVEGGNATVVVRPSWTASLPALSSSSSKRPCRYGDLYDMRGSWVEAPVPGTSQGAYEKQHVCTLEPLPTPSEAFELARRAGVRWLRLIGDSNTRNMYDAFPLVDPASTALRSVRRTPPYDLRSSYGALHDPPSAKERNWRATRQFCRVGLVDGDPQDDIVISWEWFTPVHDPPLSAYFADEPNAYWANSTLGGVFTPVEDDPRLAEPFIRTILADRPDLLSLRGGDRVFFSFGSHAHMHTRDDMDLYVDEIVAAAERLASLEVDDLSSPQKRLSFGLSTAKTCRKFKVRAFAARTTRDCIARRTSRELSTRPVEADERARSSSFPSFSLSLSPFPLSTSVSAGRTRGYHQPLAHLQLGQVPRQEPRHSALVRRARPDRARRRVGPALGEVARPGAARCARLLAHERVGRGLHDGQGPLWAGRVLHPLAYPLDVRLRGRGVERGSQCSAGALDLLQLYEKED